MRIRNATVRFGEVVAFDRLSAKIRFGEVCAVTGPPGSGKSTLLNAISGVHSLAEGWIDAGGPVMVMVLACTHPTGKPPIPVYPSGAAATLSRDKGPCIVVADEPDRGAPPPTLAKQIRADLRRLAEEGHAVVVATHIPATQSIADRVISMTPTRKVW